MISRVSDKVVFFEIEGINSFDISSVKVLGAHASGMTVSMKMSDETLRRMQIELDSFLGKLLPLEMEQ